MSATKICSVFVIGVMLCGTSLATRKQMAQQTADRQQGGAVIFFTAYQGSLRDLLFNPIIFNQVLVNQGSAYNNDTGVFTAPLAGIYQFVFAAQLCRGTHNNHWYFMVNGVQNMLCHAEVTAGKTTLNTCYFMKELKKGDQVWVKQSPESCCWASSTSKTITFSGILLASDSVSMLGGKYGSSCPLPSRNMMPSSAGRTVALSGVVVTLQLSQFLWD
ncbi:collagen alpha-1(X) chain-like [Acanthochromis polyacanthus]|uniref:collagen alpha-1(X) chain-like n=1 Tax=Acanthochromis polyacanthus TaxID=80966 RepID=UPI002233EEB0|nr:collagen alpha-1(X) chain-like [Acanthochromis polyacanthus]